MVCKEFGDSNDELLTLEVRVTVPVTGPEDKEAIKQLTREIAVLETKKRTLEERITKTKRGLAKAEGYIFENLLDLVKAAYPGKELIEDKGNFYLGKVSEETKVEIPDHYECPGCGIVSGSMFPETKAAGGVFSDNCGNYVHYKCQVCDEVLETDDSGVAYGF